MLSRSLLAVNFPAQVVNALEPGAEIVLRKNANGTVTLSSFVVVLLAAQHSWAAKIAANVEGHLRPHAHRQDPLHQANARPMRATVSTMHMSKKVAVGADSEDRVSQSAEASDGMINAFAEKGDAENLVALSKRADANKQELLDNHLNVQYSGEQELPVIYDTGSFEVLVLSTKCNTCVKTLSMYDYKKSSSFRDSPKHVVAEHEFVSGDVVTAEGFETLRLGRRAFVAYSIPGISRWAILQEVFDTHQVLVRQVGKLRRLSRGCLRYDVLDGAKPRIEVLEDRACNFFRNCWSISCEPWSAFHIRIRIALWSRDPLSSPFTALCTVAFCILPWNHSYKRKRIPDGFSGDSSEDRSLLEEMRLDSFALCYQRGGTASPGWLKLGPSISAMAHDAGFQSVDVSGDSHWATKLSQFKVDLDGIDTTSLCKPSCGALIDSGTSLLTFPRSASHITDALKQKVKKDCSNLDQLPTLYFELDGAEVVLPPRAYIFKVLDNNGNPYCRGAFMKESQFGEVFILGMPFLRYYFTVFDRQNKQVHIARSTEDCQVAHHMSLLATNASASGRGTALIERAGSGSAVFEATPADLGDVISPSWAALSNDKMNKIDNKWVEVKRCMPQEVMRARESGKKDDFEPERPSGPYHGPPPGGPPGPGGPPPGYGYPPPPCYGGYPGYPPPGYGGYPPYGYYPPPPPDYYAAYGYPPPHAYGPYGGYPPAAPTSADPDDKRSRSRSRRRRRRS
eukprot:s1077_g3.t1